MGNLSITFLNSPIGTIESNFITSFSFIEDINKLYVGAKLNLKDISQTIFNSIKSGQELKVTFYDSNASYKETSYDNYLKILTFSKTPTSSPLFNNVEITLISSWYFSYTINTQAYRGNVGSILNAIYQKEYSTTSLKANLISTDDEARIRYRISESTSDFMKRLLRYGISQNSPVYLYTGLGNILNLSSLNTFVNKSLKYSLVPDEVFSLKETSQKVINEAGSMVLRLRDYKQISSVLNSSSNCTSYFSTANFASTSSITTSVILQNAENGNSTIEETSPSTVTYTDWSLTPQDALAYSIKSYYDKNLNTFSIVGEVDTFCLSSLNLGDLVKIYLPVANTDENSSINCRGYIIQRIERIYKEGKEKVIFTAFLARF